jgi:hypothetical protein
MIHVRAGINELVDDEDISLCGAMRGKVAFAGAMVNVVGAN